MQILIQVRIDSFFFNYRNLSSGRGLHLSKFNNDNLTSALSGWLTCQSQSSGSSAWKLFHNSLYVQYAIIIMISKRVVTSLMYWIGALDVGLKWHPRSICWQLVYACKIDAQLCKYIAEENYRSWINGSAKQKVERGNLSLLDLERANHASRHFHVIICIQSSCWVSKMKFLKIS